ncbi:MAG TPA: FAD-binding oxidoreductase [Candidatus Dormibacteraeota bacterium]
MTKTRSFWGWGYEEDALSAEERAAVGLVVADRLGGAELYPRPVPHVGELSLPAARVQPPAALASLLTDGPLSRAAHAYGKAFRDVVRHLDGQYPHPPDLVAFPRDEADLERLLAWCADARVGAIPYGAGSSVVGGVEPAVPDGYSGTVSIDLGRMNAVIELDETARAVRVQGGILGPALEDALRPHGLTLRHFPQSFEFSSVGGWIATRSGGHHSTLRTRIDQFVESVRMLTPSGVFETRRLPSSGAGPDPNSLVLGSEGTLGVVTEAWLRVQPRPDVRARGSARFETFAAGVEAARRVAQSGLYPAECRLLDPLEAELNGAGQGEAVLLLGFEAAGLPASVLEEQLRSALALCGARTEVSAGAASSWRSSFLRAPYLRDALALLGLVVETFETAVTWDRFVVLHERVVAAAREVAPAALVTCRFTHVYADGPAPYFTVIAPGRDGEQLRQWDAIKAACSDALSAAGGTITHHHAVGRDHRPWYGSEAPALFLDALSAAKRELDPRGVMNPGALLP